MKSKLALELHWLSTHCGWPRAAFPSHCRKCIAASLCSNCLMQCPQLLNGTPAMARTYSCPVDCPSFTRRPTAAAAATTTAGLVAVNLFTWHHLSRRAHQLSRSQRVRTLRRTLTGVVRPPLRAPHVWEQRRGRGGLAHGGDRRRRP